MKRTNKGFTLVEIIVVLVILAILAAIAIPSVIGYVDEANEAKELSKVRETVITTQATLIKAYALDNGNTRTDSTNNRTLSQEMTDEIIDRLGYTPYILMFVAGDYDDSQGTNQSQEAYKLYGIVYQETSTSKPWFNDGKRWSHRYLWNDSSTKKTGRMINSIGNGEARKNVLTADGKTKVTTYLVSREGKTDVKSMKLNNDNQFWDRLKKSSE